MSEPLTDAEEEEAGKKIAMILQLRRAPEHPDRWQTLWGTKTAQGICRTVMRIAAEVEGRTLDK